MPRRPPTTAQNFLSSVILPLLSLWLLPISLTAVGACLALERYRRFMAPSNSVKKRHGAKGREREKGEKGCVIISGGRMSKGLTLARAFKRAGWKVIGVEEEGWGELCPMRFSSSLHAFHLLPPASASYSAYSSALFNIAQTHRATLFIPVSGAGSSVEDARAADEMAQKTQGRCRTFIQDPETMLDLHDKDRFIALVDKLGLKVPEGKMVESVDEAMEFLLHGSNTNTTLVSKLTSMVASASASASSPEPKYVLKCMGLDENRGDMTLFPLKGDDGELSKTRRALEGLKLRISKGCPYVFQEFIPGQEYCTHASVINGHITSFVTCPSNDMLMTYENYTSTLIGHRAETWTRILLERLQSDPTPTGKERRLTGHFSFDFILSTKDGEMYPLECNARVHTAVILLPVSRIASCYEVDLTSSQPTYPPILRPQSTAFPRSWIYNDLIMRYLPLLPFISSPSTLAAIHPCLPACAVPASKRAEMKPSEEALKIRIDPTLVADDWVPFLVLWHVFWPQLLLRRWWQGKKWTRLNVSTGRIFEC